MKLRNITHIARAGEGRDILSETVVRTCHSVAAFILALGLGAASVTVGLGQNNSREEPPEKDNAPKTKRERIAAQKPERTVMNEHVQHNVIVVKFQEGSHVRHRMGKLVAEAHKRSAEEKEKLHKAKLDDATIAKQLETVHELLQKHPKHQLEKLFARDEADLDLEKAEADKNSEEEVADLNLYFHVLLDASTPEASAALIDQLNALDIVEIAYPQPTAEPASADLWPTTSSLTPYQGYLNAAPTGIDANYARGFYGGRGENVRVIDVEGGWNLYHEDLDWPFYIGGTFSTDPAWVNHGTAVRGEIAAAENAYGMSGIAPRVSMGVSSIFPSGAPTAINNAAAQLTAGDIILIELHSKGPYSGLACSCNCGQFEYIAIEYWQAEYDAIRNATARGIIVVEAAGNGSMNLDSAIYGGLFNRGVRDSGAIIVGAGTSNGRVPECWSNFGSRVDVQGWGDSVATLAYGDLLMANGSDSRQWYTRSFSGTSSASPIVTGAAAAIQGMRKARGLYTLNSYQMRRLLGQTGTSQASDSRNIGPLPNLRSAFDAHGTYSYITPSTYYNWTSGVVAPQGYRDYYFYSYGGRCYELSTCYYADFDTVIDVYNPYGTLIASNDDYCGLKS